MERPGWSSWLEWPAALPQHQKCPFGARRLPKKTGHWGTSVWRCRREIQLYLFSGCFFLWLILLWVMPQNSHSFEWNVEKQNYKNKVTSLPRKNPAPEFLGKWCVLVHVLYSYSNHVCLMFPLRKVSDIFHCTAEVFRWSYSKGALWRQRKRFLATVRRAVQRSQDPYLEQESCLPLGH